MNVKVFRFKLNDLKVRSFNLERYEDRWWSLLDDSKDGGFKLIEFPAWLWCVLFMSLF